MEDGYQGWIETKREVFQNPTEVWRADSRRARGHSPMTAKCEFCGKRAAIEIRGKGPPRRILFKLRALAEMDSEESSEKTHW